MSQYVVIVVPSQEIIDMVDRYRKKYARHTSYVIVPHFTVYPPFSILSSNENEIINVLKNGLAGIGSQVVKFEKIGYFEGKNNVAFFEPNAESINYLKSLLVKTTKSLEGRVKNVYDDYNFTPEKFKPHMTIAERMPEDSFVAVKEELDGLNENGEFAVSSVFVYKCEPETNQWSNLCEVIFRS
jgi:2'-5' RNA ligase